MLRAIGQFIRDIFIKPRTAWGFVKTAFGYFYLKDQRRMTMGEIRVVSRRIKTLQTSRDRDYELKFLEYWRDEHGWIESKAKMTGKRNDKLRMKTKFRDGQGRVERKLRLTRITPPR